MVEWAKRPDLPAGRTDGCASPDPRSTLLAPERIVTVEPDADKLILVLHADVGERLWGRRSQTTGASR